MSLSIVVPVYNEYKNIKLFLNKINPILNKITNNHEIIFVLDPSEDNTEEIILNEIQQDNKIKLIKFSRRFGQAAALLAGIKHSVLDNVVLIDVDLQDPPELIDKMYLLRKENFDTILAKRSKKKKKILLEI
jgi:polyisoprenyl-phosphate glycosyltransferase